VLEAYLARHPVVWLDMQIRQHGIHRLTVNGLAPLSFTRGILDEDALVDQARFLELCTGLDALGGATIVLHPAAGQRGNRERGREASLRVLRAYADLAAPFEITLGFEFRADSTAPTLEAAQELVKGAARSNLRLSLSTHEWCASQAKPRTLNALESGQLALVHLDSLPQSSQPASMHKLLPTEDEPARTLALCAHLAAAGIRGPYCVPTSADGDTPLDRARAARKAAIAYLTPLFVEQQPPLA
jgi:hypothetical protein